MNFEDIRFVPQNRRSHLAQAKKKVIGRVVRKRWTAYMVHLCNSSARTRFSRGPPIFWSWSNHRMSMAELAQKMTLTGEMATNSAAPYRVELRDVQELHAASQKAVSLADSSPFAALAARHGRPLRVAILSDFIRIPYANGAAFQTRFLYQ